MLELTGNFIIDLNNFEKLSREVGYYNCKSNQKDEDGNYDEYHIEKYEELREKQLDIQALLIEKYGK
jgi:hypothetical protein